MHGVGHDVGYCAAPFSKDRPNATRQTQPSAKLPNGAGNYIEKVVLANSRNNAGQVKQGSRKSMRINQIGSDAS